MIILIFGIIIHDDYGVPWDEGYQNKSALINVLYINELLGNGILSHDKVNNIIKNSNASEKIVPLKEYKDRHYGIVNELILLIPSFLQKSFNDSRKIILNRHLMIFLIFWISSIYFYLIIQNLYKNNVISLLGTTALILSPRIFADAFYNSKDLVLLSFFIIAVYYILKFFQYPEFKWAVICGIFSALVIDIRINALILPFSVIIISIFRIIYNNSKKIKEAKQYLNISIYLLSMLTFIYIFWPYLWEDPFNRFTESWNTMSKFAYMPNQLYLGNIINAGNIPWHYSFIWILITTPVLYSLFIICGIIIFCSKIKTNIGFHFSLITNQMNLIFIIISLGSIAVIILLNSTLYNGWRQIYYIYPFLVLLAVSFGDWLYYKISVHKILQKTLLILIIINFIFITISMFSIHPYQMLYFNKIAKNFIEGNFEKDYWGLSLREGLEWIAKNSRTKVKIFSEPYNPAAGSTRILKPVFNEKLSFNNDISNSDYLITNHVLFIYNTKNMFEFYNLKPSMEVYTKKVDGLKILSIYKLNANNRISKNKNIKLVSDNVVWNQ